MLLNSSAVGTSEVYLMRHGENLGNAWLTIHPFEDIPYTDGNLTQTGIHQALAAQTILEEKLGLLDVPASQIQLSASLLSRAFDTLVIASANLWHAWYQADLPFMVHGVPAAMEFDSTINSDRKPGVLADDPMRWQDSVLAKNTSLLAELGSQRKLLYKTPEDATATTAKPVVVQSYYERHQFGFCQPAQLASLASYLVDTSLSGKKHIVLGAHGALIACLMNVYSTSRTVPSETGEFPVAARLETQGLNNADVLHVTLRYGLEQDVVLEPRFLYSNSAQS